MRPRFGALVLLGLLLPGQALAADKQPYGCWAIRDTVERLTCFDLALGPPALGSAADHAPKAQDEPARAEGAKLAPQGGTATRD